MRLSILLCGLLLSPSPQSDCADVASCRQAALDAASREEFEAFHDLAWRAAQRGRRNDPELMTLVARAQSLSGRPGDALVMLRRLAQMGVATDAATSDDFRRVRALAGWPEVDAMLKGGAAPASTPPAAAAAVPAPAPKLAVPAAPRIEAPAPAPAMEENELPPSFASIRPAGLVYDSVSRRFIVGDRRDNKLIIFDDVFRRATDMVGAESAGFYGVVAVEIDRRRGDLWVVNSSAVRGAALHKLQLVSGRVLFEIAVPAQLGPTTFVDAAVLGDGRVLLLDAEGRRLLGVSPSQRAFERVAAVDVAGAASVASSGGRIVYVAHREGILRVDLTARSATPVRDAPAGVLWIRADGDALIGVLAVPEGHRIVRFRLDAAGRKVASTEVVDAAVKMPDPSAMTVVDGAVFYIASPNGSPVMRRADSRGSKGSKGSGGSGGAEGSEGSRRVGSCDGC